MNNKLRNITLLLILPGLAVSAVIGGVISSRNNITNRNNIVEGLGETYTLSFNPCGLLDSSSSNTEKSFVTSRVINYPLTFKYVKAYSDEVNEVTKLNRGGYIKNSTMISGITSIQYSGTGSLKLSFGYSEDILEYTPVTLNHDEEYTPLSSFNYFKIENPSSTAVELTSLTVKYSCVEATKIGDYTDGLEFSYLSESDSFKANLSNLINSNTTTLTIPDTYLGKHVTRISAETYTLNKVTTINIGKYVSTIDNGVFEYTNAITTVNVDEDNEVYTSSGNAIFSKDMTELVFLPDGLAIAGYTIPDSVATIKYKALASTGTGTVGWVIVPLSVVTIEQYGFYNTKLSIYCYATEKPAGWHNQFRTGSGSTVYKPGWHIEGGVPVLGEE